MRVRCSHAVPALVLALAASVRGAVQGAEFSLSAPPSACRRFEVNADWRRHDRLELTLERLGPAPRSRAIATVFLETKQGWWFESCQVADLREASHRFVLRLGSDSPDWQAADLLRGLGPDALRFVRAFGVKLFSSEPEHVRFRLHGPVFSPRRPGLPGLRDLQLPRAAVAGVVAPVRFRLGPASANPLDPWHARAVVIWRSDTHSGRTEAHFRQDYRVIRRPWGEQPELVPFERPVWQASWRPPAAGVFDLSVELKTAGETTRHVLGQIRVSPSAAGQSGPVSPAASGESAFVRQVHGPPICIRGERDWRTAGTDTVSTYLHAQLDWTPDWGTYAGAGEFEQSIAWDLERDLSTGAVRGPMPLLAFSEDELDDQGVYNWCDNPMSRENDGPLTSPGEFFVCPEGRALVLARCRYLWARYGHFAQTTGILLLVDRPHERVVRWINDICDTLRREVPGIRVFCNNRGLRHRDRVVPLTLGPSWRRDPRLSATTRISRHPEAEGVTVWGQYPGTTAIVSRDPVHHWGGGRAFSVDVGVSPGAGEQVTVLCSLRTGPSIVYQSALVRLREGDWNQVHFLLDRPELWTCQGARGRQMRAWELLNIREVALRFFCPQRRVIRLRIANCRLLYDTTEGHEALPPMTFTLLRAAVETVEQYGRFEIECDLNRRYRNPYDPEEVRVDVELTDPAGERRSHPAYFHEPWRLELVEGREQAVRGPPPFWRARVSPLTPGRHSWTLRARGRGEEASLGGAFDCTPATSPGFVRVSRSDPTYFEFSDGSFFYPIGHNLRSPSDRREGAHAGKALANADEADRLGTRAYERWFEAMRRHGENYSRVWMCPWWAGLEWHKDAPGYHGLAFYNQQNAARLDRIVELAEREGIYICVETANHGPFSTHIDWQWDRNPLNRVHPGGFLDHATDFFYSDEAQRLHRRRLRYTAARWGYSKAIASWGTMTEAEWTEPYFRSFKWPKTHQLKGRAFAPDPYRTDKHCEALRRWLVDSARYLRLVDSHPHLVGLHVSMPQHATEIWGSQYAEATDFVHNNAYTSFSKHWAEESFRRYAGVADVMRVFDRYFGSYRRNRPLLIGEWGGKPEENRESHLICELHTGLWAGFMTTTSGLTGYWWWNLIDAHDLYADFGAVAAFARGEERRGRGFRCSGARVGFPYAQTGGGYWERRGLMLANEDTLFAYVYPAAINRRTDSRVPASFDDPGFPRSGPGVLHVPPTLANGAYRVEYWNTFRGEVISTEDVRVSSHSRLIPLIDHCVDLALKLKPRR